MAITRRFISVDLRHLRYFVAAAEHGSFRKAGRALGICESAISRRIRDMEDNLGVSLFHRHSSGVSLTHAGKRFLQRAQYGVSIIHDGALYAASIGRVEEGTLRLGITSSLSCGFLHDLLRTYKQKYTNIHVEYIDGTLGDHVAAVRKFWLDVAFVAGKLEWDDCVTTPLWTERIFVALPASHRFTIQTEVKWSDLIHENFILSETELGAEIHDYLLQQLAEFSCIPKIEQQKVGLENMLTLVTLDIGLAVISEASTAMNFPGIAYRPMVGDPMPFSAIWSPRNDNPACRRLLSLARSMARSGKAAVSSRTSAMKSSVEPSQTPDPSR